MANPSTSLGAGGHVGHGHVGGHGGHDAHNPNLQHHFYSMEQQLEASTLGMWLFLVTEIMFFGGMFMAYIVYRMLYPEACVLGSNHLDVALGALNTGVLIFSSLTMALAVRAAQVGSRARSARQPGADDVLRHGVPRRQVLRVRREVRASPGARAALRRDAAAGRAAAVVLLDLFHDDRHPRRPHGGRTRTDERHPVDGLAWPVLCGLLHPG